MILRIILALLAGGSLTLAFAPYQAWWVAYLCVALLLWIWETSTWKQAFVVGWFFGVGLFGFGVYWVFISIHVFGHTNIWIASLLTTLFIGILALFPAFQGTLLNILWRGNHWHKRYLAFPSLWVLIECLRSWLFTGFPWLLLGNSQVSSPMKGFAPLTSVYGLSFLVALLGASILELKSIKRSLMPLSLFAIVWLSGWSLNQVHWTHPTGQPRQVSVIQGNIQQRLKWDRDAINHIIDTYWSLTQNTWDSDIIIWPESALPVFRSQAEPLLQAFDQKATQKDTALLLGILLKKDTRYYNGLIVLGQGQGEYRKHHLVPFGEYLPFESWLRGLIAFFSIPMSDFSAGPLGQPLLQASNVKIAPFICYEIAFPTEVFQKTSQATLIVTVTDDAWFGRSIAQAQHIQMAQMRALETGRFIVFASNNGITGVINPQGEIIQHIPPFEKGILTSHVTPIAGQTPIMRLGIHGIIIFMGALLILSFIINRYSSKPE